MLVAVKGAEASTRRRLFESKAAADAPLGAVGWEGPLGGAVLPPKGGLGGSAVDPEGRETPALTWLDAAGWAWLSFVVDIAAA